MNKVHYYQLPVNVKIACIPLWFGMFSLFFFIIASGMAVQEGLITKSSTVLNFAIYLSSFFLLKRKNKLSFISALAILGVTTAYNYIIIYNNYRSHVQPVALSFWWPSIHTSAFLLSLVLISLPPSWKFYKN